MKRAEGEYRTARLAHEAAMLAVKEYPESTYLLDKAATQCEIKLAESELAQASDHVDEVQKKFEKGAVSKAQKVAAELSFQQTKFALELAQMKLNTLENVHQAEHGQAARRRGREDTRPGARREGHPGAAAGPRAEDPPPDRGLPDRGPVGRPGVPCAAPGQAGRRDQRHAGRRGRPRPRAAGRRPRRARDTLIGWLRASRMGSIDAYRGIDRRPRRFTTAIPRGPQSNSSSAGGSVRPIPRSTPRCNRSGHGPENSRCVR